MSTNYSSVNTYPNVLASFQQKPTTKKDKGINLNSLESAARTMENKAEEVLSKDRLVNTARRARMADGVESEARKQLALAKTIFRLVDGIKAGETKYLSNVRTKVQIELLQYTISYAKNRRASKLRLPEWETKNKPIEEADAEFASYPYPWLSVHDSNKLLALSQSITALDKPLAKLKALTSFDESKAIHLDSPEKLELLEVIIKELKSSSRVDDIRLLDSINGSMTDYQRLCQIGIPDLPTLIEALKEYCRYCSNTPKEDPVKRLERELIGCKIPGYFPTPKIVVERMLQLARIEPSMTVIEGSAGKGNIADLIKEYYPTCSLSVMEINYTLRDILKAKGHNFVGRDFLEHTESYDRVVQNPPFERFQDVEHCFKAFSLLKPGGRLVSIMGASCFFREDKKAVEFRSWLEEVNGYSEELPKGSFLESERSTGVAAWIVVIDKPFSNEPLVTVEVESTQVEVEALEVVEEVLYQQVESNAVEETTMPIVEEITTPITAIELVEVNEIQEHTQTITPTTSIEINEPVEEKKCSDGILKAEDYEAIKDHFLQHQESYKMIMINPEQHSSKDIDRIYHAYCLLEPGGSLVANVPDLVFAQVNKLYLPFRKWLKSINAAIKEIPDNKYLIVATKNTLF